MWVAVLPFASQVYAPCPSDCRRWPLRVPRVSWVTLRGRYEGSYVKMWVSLGEVVVSTTLPSAWPW